MRLRPPRHQTVVSPRSDGDMLERRTAEQALADSEERFRTLVSNIPGAIYRCALDADWTMEFMSDDVETITGYPPSDFISNRVRTYASVIHPDDRDEVERAVREAVAARSPFALEYRVVTAGGDVRWVYEKGQAVLGRDGKPLWLDGAIFDVTVRKESEAERERLLERLVEAERITHLGSWIWDIEADKVTWSDELFRIWGLDPAEFGASYEAYLQTVHPDDRELVDAEVRRAFETGGFEYDCRILRRDGSERFVRGRGKVVYAESGVPASMIGTAQDITAQREQEERLRQSDQLFRSIVESAPLGVNVCDLDGRVIESNQTLREMLGYTADELHGMSWTQFTHPDDLTADLQLFREVVEGQRDYYQIEKRDLRKDGTPLWIRLTVSAVRNDRGELELTLAMVEDISERKEIESERERLLTQERAQNARLRELDRLKDTFVASVSHELRTPLTSISGFLQVMRDGLAGETTEEQRRCIAIATRNTERLHRLIGDLLFVAQMDAGHLALEHSEVDLRAVAAECVESVRPRAVEMGIELVLEGDAPAALEGDQARLAQLLDNLVSNAIKFSTVGGRVAVRTRSENGTVVLEVADEGIGIPAGEQQHLFERFFRSSNAAKHAIQGTGLGLSIVKAIVEAHGGTIAVESAADAGTTFRVALPVKRSVVAPRRKRGEAV